MEHSFLKNRPAAFMAREPSGEQISTLSLPDFTRIEFPPLISKGSPDFFRKIRVFARALVPS